MTRADVAVKHRLPLHLRLPNPPPLFIGREAELRWISAALERSPVVLVTGEREIGKSALLMRAVHARPNLVERTIYLSLRERQQDPVGVALVRALALAERVEDLPWRELLTDPPALIGLALDLAESDGRWVVIDDLECAEAGDRAELLATLARYGRQARFLITSREPIAALPAELAEQRLVLGPMHDADLESLARDLDPARAAAMAPSWIEAASGSPGRLRRAVLGTLEIDELSPADKERLALLATANVALPLELVTKFVGEEHAIDRLQRRGLVEVSDRGVRVRDRAREHPPAMPEGNGAARELALAALDALAGADDHETILEAVRLGCFAGRSDKSHQILERAGTALLAAGFAARLQRILAASSDPVLDAWRMRSALATDDPAVLDSISPPAQGAGIEISVLWSTVLLARGKMEDAAAEARAVWQRARDQGNVGAAADVAIVLARALNNLRRHDESLEVLSLVEPAGEVARAERDAIAIAALGELGRHDEMRARVSAVAPTLGRLPVPHRIAAAQAIARALYNAGQLRDAARLLDTVTTGFRSGMAPVLGRLLPFLRACIAVDTGDTKRARAELDQLAPYVGALLRPYYANARAMLALIDGEQGDVERWLADREGSPLPPWVRAEREALELAVRELRRAPAEDLPPTSGRAHGVFGPLSQIRRAHVEVHASDRQLDEVRESLPPTAHPELSILADIVRADAALAAGNARSATELSGSARIRAREIGYAPHTARALQVLCDAALAADDSVGLQRWLDELEALSVEMPSRRFADVASWYRATLEMDVAKLEKVAGSSAAPDVALRARAQLGEDAQLGRVDRVVLAAPAARRAPRARVVGGSAEGERWGIDEPRARVWFHDGTHVDLAKQPALFKLLVCLARAGGSASKEQLVALVWDEPGYHPLRHDNRLQAAVRKLRLRIEIDAAAPSRLRTTEDGYALGGRVRFVALAEVKPRLA